MATPDRQTLTLALLQVAAAHDGPAGLAFEDPPRCFHLIVEVAEPREPHDQLQKLDLGPESPGVGVLTVAGDVPATREDQPRPGLGEVEYRLGGPRCVVRLPPPWREHGEHAAAPCHCVLDHIAVIRPSWDHRDPLPIGIELRHALLPTNADH